MDDIRYVVQVFIGKSMTLADAAEQATGRLNEWLPLQMQTVDGIPCTRLKTIVKQDQGQWIYIISAFGLERKERAYTGQTERLG